MGVLHMILVPASTGTTRQAGNLTLRDPPTPLNKILVARLITDTHTHI